MLYTKDHYCYATSQTIDGIYYIEDYDSFGTAYITVNGQDYILV